MSNIKIILIFVVAILVCMFMLILRDENQSDDELIKEKTFSEIENIEDTIIDIIEKYLKNDYTENEEIDWENIKDDFSEVSNLSSVIILDLSNFQIEDNSILEFETRINNVNSAIENKSPDSLIENLKDLYKLLPDYTELIYPEETELYLEKRVESYLIESIYYCLIDDYNSAIDLVQEAESIYQELMNNVNYINENSYKVNRVYIAIQEFKICVQNEDKNNAILKFINIS